jgi:hypothetical protein
MPPHTTNSRGFGHEFGRFDPRHDFAFRHHDLNQFRDRDFNRDDRFRNRDFDRDDGFEATILITIVMTSSVLISLRLASLGGTPTLTTTTPITTTHTITPSMTTDQLTITSIGTIWLSPSNRNLHGAAITRERLTV